MEAKIKRVQERKVENDKRLKRISLLPKISIPEKQLTARLLTHSLTYSLSYHLLTYSLTHSLTDLLTHSYSWTVLAADEMV